MKRSVSALLILIYWLGPLMAALPASAESRLPACCRRNGAHHCVMTGAMAAPDAAPVISSPARCSSFPADAMATSGPVCWLCPHLLQIPAQAIRTHRLAICQTFAQRGQFRLRIPRAPPASSLA